MSDNDTKLANILLQIKELLDTKIEQIPSLSIYLPVASTPVKEEPIKSFEAPTRFGVDRSSNPKTINAVQKKLIDYITWAATYGDTYKVACEAYELFKSDPQYKVPTAISTKPELTDGEARLLKAFWDLQSSRNSYGNIPFSEMLLYYREMGWTDIHEQGDFLGYMFVLDLAYNNLCKMYVEQQSIYDPKTGNSEDTGVRKLVGGLPKNLAAELSALRAELREVSNSIIRHTANTAKQLERWNYDGLPATRSID